VLLLVKAGVALLAAAGVTTAVVVAATPDTPSVEQAVVTHLVDGDTLDVSVAGRTERVRMLNIDTPEVTGPESADQCLGQEASAHLASLVPVGTPVRLEFDRERTDGYGRTLAGVFTNDGVLVNAEMARAGLAMPIVIGENDRFHPPVLAARDEAAAQGRGLFSAEVTCTLPGQVAAVSAVVAEAPKLAAHPPGASSAELESSVAPAADALAAARGLEDAFTGDPAGIAWRVLTLDERGRLAEQVRSVRKSAEDGVNALRDAAAATRGQEEAAARAAEEQERRERAAEEQRQARLAEERRQAQLAEERRQARLAEERRQTAADERRAREAADEAPRRRAAPDPDPSPSAGDPYPGYTGPRCYAPGGKTWRPC
jgi:micrococcal nuclease